MATSLEERLCEEIRRHPHLYDSSLKSYREPQKVIKSWREIAQTLGRDENFCRSKWKYMRDRYVKAKKRLKAKSGDTAKSLDTPPIVPLLDWLSDYIRHRSPGELEDALTAPLPPSGSPEPTYIFAPLSPSSSVTTPTDRKRKKKEPPAAIQEDILNRLKRMDRDRATENEESPFGRMIAEMLIQLPAQKRMDAKFEIHQLLYRMHKEMRQENPDT